jgi:hypothetical protein
MKLEMMKFHLAAPCIECGAWSERNLVHLGAVLFGLLTVLFLV